MWTKSSLNFTFWKFLEHSALTKILFNLSWKYSSMFYPFKNKDFSWNWITYTYLFFSLQGDLPAVKSILTALDSGSVQNLINFAPGGANTLLFKACENGHRDVVNFLLDKGKYRTVWKLQDFSVTQILREIMSICNVKICHFNTFRDSVSWFVWIFALFEGLN